MGCAELMATTKGASEALGMLTLLEEMGTRTKSRLHIDASAALGISQRQGIGKVRHLDVQTLWVQEQEVRNKIELLKVAGSQNPADLMTKGMSEDLMLKHLRAMDLDYMHGRPEIAANLMVISKKEVKESAAYVSSITLQRKKQPSLEPAPC